ncbi:hypothetical protein CAEBREN_24984 [Caenorhabditis brenneri]|uniref:Serpentine Receptor, class H n=1 Tax=Caenorhabditis brenneri TaxID=135651 RepID=G0MTZ9_CAEBE|nr:hypothetical protein CAEBREN_24984 [Caenorhabditis brenneri]
MTNLSISYISTPDFVVRCYHILSCFEIPIHLLGAYVILFETPVSMKSVKWNFMNAHFWSVLLDWTISILTVPYLLLPAMAGLSMGLLTSIGVPIRFHTYIFDCVIATAFTSLIGIAENRLYILFMRFHWWRKVRIPFLILHYLFPPLCFVFLFFNIPNQKTAIETLKKTMQIDPLIFEYELFVLAEDFRVVLTCYTIFFTVYTLEFMIFACLLVINLEKMTKDTKLSQRTMEMQKNLLKAVMIQIFTPYILVALPLFYVGFSVVLDYYNQILNNICFMIVSLHGLASTIVMLMIHKPYRQFCQKVFCLKFKMFSVGNGENSVNPGIAKELELNNIPAADLDSVE